MLDAWSDPPVSSGGYAHGAAEQPRSAWTRLVRLAGAEGNRGNAAAAREGKDGSESSPPAARATSVQAQLSKADLLDRCNAKAQGRHTSARKIIMCDSGECVSHGGRQGDEDSRRDAAKNAPPCIDRSMLTVAMGLSYGFCTTSAVCLSVAVTTAALGRLDRCAGSCWEERFVGRRAIDVEKSCTTYCRERGLDQGDEGKAR